MRIYYENNEGEKIHFSKFPLVMQEPETVLDSEWKYGYVQNKNGRNQMTGFYKDVAEKTASLSVFADSKEEYDNIMEQLLQVMEKDIISNTPGKLYVNDYYLECYVIARNYSEYEEDYYAVESTIRIIAPNPCWIREREYQFLAVNAVSSDNRRYPYKYPYRYANGLMNIKIINDYIQECDFRMVIQGPVLNPQIIIGGHPYQVNTVLEVGELLIIDSATRTVKKVMNNGTILNVFEQRNKEKSVFKKIAPGRNQVSWSGKYDFSICTYEERSEPRWH